MPEVTLQPAPFRGLEHPVRSLVPLSQWTTFGVGGAAQYYAEPPSVSALAQLARRCRDYGLPLRILGRGSNLVIHTPTVPGLVVRLTASPFQDVLVLGRRVEVGGGAPLAQLITAARAGGLSGVHRLAGIPATVGGAVRCNAGSFGCEVGQLTAGVTVLTENGDVECLDRRHLRFGYRTSNLVGLVVLRADFELIETSPAWVTAEMRSVLLRRLSTQPRRVRSAGCVFKNPPGDHAGRLIEVAGLKGARVGGARVSERHANFITTLSGATTLDILHLIDLVRRAVHDRTGVNLEPEVEVW